MSYFGNNAQICAHVPVPMNIAHYLPCSLPLCSLLSAVHFPALRRQLPGRPPNTYRHNQSSQTHQYSILSDNTPRLSVNSPKVFCNTPKVLKNALAAFYKNSPLLLRFSEKYLEIPKISAIFVPKKNYK